MQKRGQVWVETVMYTLIAFIMIGMALSFIQPKIQEYRDKTIVEQSINILKDVDQTIREVGESAVGNKRKIEVLLREGSLEINPTNETIILTIDDNKYAYSESGKTIQDGNIKILTLNRGEHKKITLSLNYTNVYVLKVNNSTNTKTLTKASNSYNIFISNKGGENQEIEIDIS